MAVGVAFANAAPSALSCRPEHPATSTSSPNNATSCFMVLAYGTGVITSMLLNIEGLGEHCAAM